DGEECLRDRRSAGEIETVRHGEALRRRRDTVLGIAAARHQRAHVLALAPAAHVGPDRGNGPGHFQAGNIRRARRRRIPALPLHHVRPIDTGGRDLDQDLAASRLGPRALHRDEHVRVTRLANLYSDHGGHEILLVLVTLCFQPHVAFSPHLQMQPRKHETTKDAPRKTYRGHSSPNAAAVVAGSSRIAASAMPRPRLSANTAHNARTLETNSPSVASSAANSRSSRTAARRVRRNSSIRCARLCHSVKTRWPRSTQPIVAPAPSAMKIATVNGVSIHHSLINQPSTAAATYNAETMS